MRITKTQLKQIIMEEINEVGFVGVEDGMTGPIPTNDYREAFDALYRYAGELGDEKLERLIAVADAAAAEAIE